MPIEKVPGTELKYYLVAFDKNGVEHSDDPEGVAGRLSARLTDDITKVTPGQRYTDVFVFTHGWKGDIPSAREQYNRWIAAMAACTADIEQIRVKRLGFRPLLVGLHWPSQPWGDENVGGVTSFAVVPGATIAGTSDSIIGQLVDIYADRIADTLAAREALRVILTSAMHDAAPATLPPEVRKAYDALNRETRLGQAGVGGDPGSDRLPFDAEQRFQLARQSEAAAFGTVGFGGILSPLRQLSFWTMKQRARDFGEGGGATFVSVLQDTVGSDTRIHLMGHSFGCIVVSGILNGPGGKRVLSRPVHSAALVQGALSLWSYCDDIPHAKGTPGYFNKVRLNRMVAGPLLTTQSVHDTAVGKFYPLAAGVAGQVAFVAPELPKFGAVGAFGVRGPGCDAEDLDMLPINGQYAFKAGGIYNLNASEFITGGDGPSGAHSNIDRPQVAHALWSAAQSEVAL